MAVRWIYTCFIVVSTLIVSVVTHEMGHGIGIWLSSAGTAEIVIWPGVSVYPEMGIRHTNWPDNAIAATLVIPQPDVYPDLIRRYGYLFQNASVDQVLLTEAELTQLQSGIIQFAGSGFNLVIAMVSSLLIYQFQPSGTLRLVLWCGAFLFYDILFYTLLPTYFDLNHLIWLGGSEPEPIVGLVQLGLTPGYAVAAVLTACTLQGVFMFSLARDASDPLAGSARE